MFAKHLMLFHNMNIVTIGGGTGTFTVLTGLKKYSVDLTAIVTMADSGGSTGRLRDEFGSLPVGDVRMALAALADDDDGRNLLRDLFLFRFDKGEKGLHGHNFGNLFLVALEELLGSQKEAITAVSKILRVKGKVLPVTTQDTHLVAQYSDGSVLKGETFIDEPPTTHDVTQRITKLGLDPVAKITPEARTALAKADVIVLGPGDLYTSLLANCVVQGVREAISQSKGKFLYVTNLMSKRGQTSQLTAADHIKEVEKYTGRMPDIVVHNNRKLPVSILQRYAHWGEYPIADDLDTLRDVRIVRGDIIAIEAIKKSSGDMLRRSLIRHDADKLAKVIMDIITE